MINKNGDLDDIFLPATPKKKSGFVWLRQWKGASEWQWYEGVSFAFNRDELVLPTDPAWVKTHMPWADQVDPDFFAYQAPEWIGQAICLPLEKVYGFLSDHNHFCPNGQLFDLIAGRL